MRIMPKYEHKVIRVGFGHTNEFETALNEAGAEGWRLVCSAMDPNNSCVVVMERIVKGPDPYEALAAERITARRE